MGLKKKIARSKYRDSRGGPLFPHSRKEVFLELIRYRKAVLMKTSLLLVLFALPAAVLIFLCLYTSAQLPALAEGGAVALPVEGDLDLSVRILRIRMFNLALLGGFLTNALLFLGLGGAIYVLQELVWGENVSVCADFGHGIKRNAVYFLVSSLFFSAAMFFSGFVIGYYSVAEAPAAVKAICFAIAALIAFFALGALVYALPHGNLYRLGIFRSWRNALLFLLVRLPRAVLCVLLCTLPLLLLLIPGMIARIAVTFLLLFFYPAFAPVICLFEANAAFDVTLNTGENASIAQKGIEWKEENENDQGGTK